MWTLHTKSPLGLGFCQNSKLLFLLHKSRIKASFPPSLSWLQQYSSSKSKRKKKKKSIFACGRLLNKSPYLRRLGAAVSPPISFNSVVKICFSSSPSEKKSCYCRHLRCLHLFIFLQISGAIKRFLSLFSCIISSAQITEKSLLAKLCLWNHPSANTSVRTFPPSPLPSESYLFFFFLISVACKRCHALILLSYLHCSGCSQDPFPPAPPYTREVMSSEPCMHRSCKTQDFYWRFSFRGTCTISFPFSHLPLPVLKT